MTLEQDVRRFAISDKFEANFVEDESSRSGEVYFVERNNGGGANLTPIARFFAWRPEYIEGSHPHWRIDCFVRKHTLAPNAKWLGKALTEAIIQNGICDPPIWTSWHSSEELQGEAYGEVFDLD